MHVQKKCSELTRKQRGLLDKSGRKCPICVDKDAQQRMEEAQDDREVESQCDRSLHIFYTQSRITARLVTTIVIFMVDLKTV